MRSIVACLAPSILAAAALACAASCGGEASTADADLFPPIDRDAGVSFAGDETRIGGPDGAAGGCRTAADCPAELPHCDPVTGACLECTSTADCGGGACLDGHCASGATSCTPAARYCAGDQIVVCDATGQESDRIDCRPHVCIDGECLLCRPNEITCQDADVVRCDAGGTGLTVLRYCETEGGCEDGVCVACHPLAGRCEGSEAFRCADDGSGWEAQQDCAAGGLACVQGVCVSPCATDPKSQTNAGCDFWAVDLHNAREVSELGEVYDAQNAPFAVIVSNTADHAVAEVIVTYPDGNSQVRNIAPRSLETFDLPADFGLTGSGLSRDAFHLRSTQPVTVYQFNPLANVDVFSNDASVLLPAPSLGMDYYVASHGQTGSYAGYFVVVAVQEGTTTVTIHPTVATAGGAGVSPIAAGGEAVVELRQGEVLAVESDQIGGDLSGSHVVSDRPVVVFGGHVAATTADRCCADHLEQQLLPVSRWGTHYIATYSHRRMSESDHWLLLAAEPDTSVSLSPVVAAIPSMLSPGVPVWFQANQDFEVVAGGPILLVRFLASSYEILAVSNLDSCWDNSDCPPGYDCFVSCEPPSCLRTADCPSGHICTEYGMCEPVGDPAMILSVPAEQYRKDFVFLTPESYVEDYVNIVAPLGVSVVLDGATIPSTQFSPVGTSGYAVLRREVTDGVHVLTSPEPVGLVVYGYDDDVSYGYPGGLGLEELRAD